MTGFGLKVPKEVADANGGIEKMCDLFYAHMERFVPKDTLAKHWLIGFDSKFCAKPHYHFHFEAQLLDLCKKSIQNHKNKFSIKNSAMKFYIFNDDGDYDLYKWLAYAGKEQIIKWSQTLDENLLKIRIKESLAKKSRDWEEDLKKLQEKELKEELWDNIIQHVQQNSARLFSRHFSEISPIQFRQLVIDYYRGQEDKKAVRRQDLVMWQTKYFMYYTSMPLEELDRLIMNPTN